MGGFQENFQNPNLWDLIPLNPLIKIFPKYGSTLKWCPLLPSTIMQKIKNFFLKGFSVNLKMHKNAIVISMDSMNI